MGSAALLCVLSLLEVVAGVALDDYNIKTAVNAWLNSRSYAEAAYGHISTWETGRVTDMSCLFFATSSYWCSDVYNTAAASFNDDIGAWDTSGVTTMDHMFYKASAFNQDISGWAVHNVRNMNTMFSGASAFNQDIGDWAVHSVTSMYGMFGSASAFNQDLGWCVDLGDYAIKNAFDGTQCESTSCGVQQGVCYMTDSIIRRAVAVWFDDRSRAEATYGHISTWETGRVTDMSYLFCGNQHESLCNTAAASFNEDITAWDTSGVRSTDSMFYRASSFNQDIGAWAVHKVTTMEYMFYDASAFDQDIGGWAVHSVISIVRMFASADSFDQNLGWCLDDDVIFENDYGGPFDGTPCESTSCGVHWQHCPTKENDKEQTPVAIIAGAVAGAALLLAIGAFCFYSRRKAPMTDMAEEASTGQPPPLTPTTAFLKSLETRSPAKPETRAAANAKFAPPFQRPGFTRKLSSFLFGEQEEEPTALSVAEAEEAPSAEQPPPAPPRRWFSRAEPEPSAPKFEEMYNQIAAWYNEPENAALRARWGAYPDPGELQTWPGFVRVTNAYLDATVLDGEAVTSPASSENVVDAEPVSPSISFWAARPIEVD
jgi:hypothetical protein